MKHTFWVARDKHEGTLTVFVDKPVSKGSGKNAYWTTPGSMRGFWMYIYNDMFPDLKFEDGPQEVEITFKKQ